MLDLGCDGAEGEVGYRLLRLGRGVDVVFNSLNKDFIEKSLSVLSQNGRFVEIGKLGIWDADQMKKNYLKV